MTHWERHTQQSFISMWCSSLANTRSSHVQVLQNITASRVLGVIWHWCLWCSFHAASDNKRATSDCWGRFVPSSSVLAEKLCLLPGLPVARAACNQPVSLHLRLSPSMQAVLQLQDKQSVCLGTRHKAQGCRGPGQSRGFGQLYPGMFGLVCSTAVPLWSLVPVIWGTFPKPLPARRVILQLTYSLWIKPFFRAVWKTVPWLLPSVLVAKTPNS